MSQHPAFAAGKAAVITGAASGIGLAAAKRFAGLGMRLLLADVHGDKLEAAAAEVRAQTPGASVACFKLDVAQYAQVAALKDLAFQTYGRVDVLMNNAGISLKTGSWDELEHWRALIDVNLWAIVHGVHAFTQAMIDQDTPALIVNTGSKQGITNPPGNPAYNVSKAGVKVLTEALQHSLRNTADCKLSAHLLVPGYTFTGMTRRAAQDKPAGAWWPEQVVDYMIEAIGRGSFYIICPDGEVTSAEDARRILWGAGDLALDRPALSRWHPDYREAFAKFQP